MPDLDVPKLRRLLAGECKPMRDRFKLLREQAPALLDLLRDCAEAIAPEDHDALQVCYLQLQEAGVYEDLHAGTPTDA